MSRTLGLRISFWAAALSAAALVSACGGGGGGGIEPVTYGVQVEVTGNGKVTSPSGIDCGATCSTNIPTGTSITLTAEPAALHQLAVWGGACTSTNGNSCTVNVTQATRVTASFAAQSFRVDVAVTGQGRVTAQPAVIDCGAQCSAMFAALQPVVFTATPAQGQRFQAWGGACSGNGGPTCTLSLTQAETVTAAFEVQPTSEFTLGVGVSGQGTVNSQPAGIQCGSSCSASFAAASSVTLTATPGQGQLFQAWGGACSGSAPTCTVTMSAARNATATFVADPGTPARAWGAAALMEPSDDFNVTESGLVYQVNAISPNGDAMVIWQQPDGQPNGGTSKVYSRMYIAGQGWLPIIQVPDMSDFSSRQLVGGKLFIDAQRTATWIRPGLDTRRFTPPGNWTGPFNPPAPPAGAGQLSNAVMDQAGNIGLVTSGGDVYQITLGVNGQWLGWARLDASGSLDTDVADIARSANGSAMAIWVERNPGDGNDSMKAARFDPATGWQGPVTIDNSLDDVDQNSPPRVAMDAAGNAIAVWRQGSALRVATFSQATGWAAPTAHDQNALGTQPLQIRLAMAPSGRAVVSWQSGLYAIKTMSYTPGTGFATPLIANTYGLERQLGIDDQGNAVLVYTAPDQWPNPTSPEISIYARHMAWGQTWGPQVLLETQPGGLKNGLAVAFNAAGAAVASWAQNDGVSSPRNSLWSNLLR